MSGPEWLIAVATGAALALLAAIGMSALRLVLGPTAADRAVALDLITVLGTGLMAVLALLAGSELYLDVALALALVGFLGTVALARYVAARERGAAAKEAGDG
ncbi:MAG TPA: monovalent cation/H+ antiporter complex subunit F [Pelomicrobium sp.]|nr:monovalent cation/H+ antiporter complex subunit F [Pelomicrobium sp.]